MIIQNKLIDYKMVYYKTDNKTGDTANIIFNQCEKEVKKFKQSLGNTDDFIVVYDYSKAPSGIKIKLYAYEK